ncbi:hypothetical protein FKG94_03105 [Exilibacterium tricleocarpae]|uniref:Phage tail assembly protein n=1 Tax=Exilibacterium tricleocarpae TaxID=2591008 RepID=A0A545U6U3_9GAMM|nr:hypothetical protein [Exilibacterium tricleocarpae]TQV85192.1 hypothetical protein FKG94_03105 [Exilibacterium tricleocarpae]
MAISFQEMRQRGGSLELEPESVQIDGLSEDILIYRFSWNDFEKILNHESGEGVVPSRVHQVVCLLNPPGYEPTLDDIDFMTATYTLPQIKDMYSKALDINGFGHKAQKDAQKN